MTVAQGMRPVLAGLVLGAVGSWWLSRYFTALLFGIKPLDTPTYFAVAALLLATALIACYLPGRRAMRIDETEIADRLDRARPSLSPEAGAPFEQTVV